MPGLNLRRRGMNFAIEMLRRGVILRRRPIPWEITWFPTFNCNLNCGYCCVPRENFSSPRPEKACQTIIDLKPASVSILGGEPYLIPKMPEYLRRIREALPKVYLFITTNGMVGKQRLLDSASYLDVLCVSIDGLGDYQRKPRGGDPEKILDNVWAYNDHRKTLDGKHEICINTVATTDNIQHLPEFFQYIADRDPSIYIMCQGMHPFNASNGLGRRPDLADEFVAKVAKQQADGMHVFLVGQLADSHTRLKSEKSHEVEELEATHRQLQDGALYTCHQEKFNAMILPHGALHTCRSYSTLNKLRTAISCDIREKHPVRALRRYLGCWRDMVLKPMDFECGHFTGCPEWLEDILQTKAGDCDPEEIARIRGRLSAESIRASAEFIRSQVNPKFDEAMIKDLPAQATATS